MRSRHVMLMALVIPGAALAQAGSRPAWQGDPPLAGTVPTLDPAAGHPRPAHGPLFISPMGEPFRGPNPQDIWFRQADADGDGRVSRAEFLRDADRFFAVLDRGQDGEIDPDDIDYYETVLAPEIRTGGSDGGSAARGTGPGGGGRRGGGHGGHGGGGGDGGGKRGSGSGGDEAASTSSDAQPHYSEQRRGAARYSWFDLPEPIVAADTNMNRGVDPTEFRQAAEQRFAALDKNGDGFLSRNELPPLPSGSARDRRGRGALPPAAHPPQPQSTDPAE